MTRVSLMCLLFLLSFLIFFAVGLVNAEIILLDPPPDGYEYGKPEPVNVGGEVYWIANRIVESKPTIWSRAKEEMKWVIVVGCTALASLSGVLIKLGVIKTPLGKRS